MKDSEEFDAFVVGRYRALVSFGLTLTGSHAGAEDLVQEALVKSWRHWRRIRADDPYGYVRTTLARTFYSAQRRRSSRELPTDRAPDVGVAGGQERAADADLLLRALLSLPPQMRTVVVLRHREDLSERAVADLLGCSLGTVKSQSSRGLARLRDLLALDQEEP